MLATTSTTESAGDCPTAPGRRLFTTRACYGRIRFRSVHGWLYFTVNQLERGARFHGGHDLRQKPYTLFRVKINGSPVALK